jgi:hypothetical protein
MEPLTRTEMLDRHALVLPIWLAAALVAATLLRYGLGDGGAPYLFGAFAVVLASFAGHVIVNAVFRTTFTPRELGLGLVVFAVALLAFGLATLVNEEFRARAFLPMTIGFVVLSAGVIFYMITHFGVRRTFAAFDVIRDFR